MKRKGNYYTACRGSAARAQKQNATRIKQIDHIFQLLT